MIAAVTFGPKLHSHAVATTTTEAGASIIVFRIYAHAIRPAGVNFLGVDFPTATLAKCLELGDLRLARINLYS